MNQIPVAVVLSVTLFGTASAVNAPGELVPGEFATTQATQSDLATSLAPFGERFFTQEAFDGDWYSAEQGMALRIAGGIGVATTPYAKAARSGEIVLRLRRINRATRNIFGKPGAHLPWFDGRVLRPDGRWMDVQGRITPLGRLLMISRAGYPTIHWAMERARPGDSAVASAPVSSPRTPALPVAATPAASSANASFSCDMLGVNEMTFCKLLKEVGDQASIGLLQKDQEIAIRVAYLALFRSLPLQAQRQLLTGKFLDARFFAPAYRTSIDRLLKKPPLISYFDYGIGNFFVDMIKAAYDAWLAATALNADAPWTYAMLQASGDQIYVGLNLLLVPKPLTTPQARALEALFLETQITVQHLESVTASLIALRRERQETVGSWAISIQKSASVALLQEVGLQASGSTKVGLDSVLTTVKNVVAGSDILRFDEIVRLIYGAQLERLRAGAVNTAEVTRVVNQALNLAAQLDGRRSLLDKLYITTYGSYSDTAYSLLQILNLMS